MCAASIDAIIHNILNFSLGSMREMHLKNDTSSCDTAVRLYKNDEKFKKRIQFVLCGIFPLICRKDKMKYIS
jgi:hypothetical protein